MSNDNIKAGAIRQSHGDAYTAKQLMLDAGRFCNATDDCEKCRFNGNFCIPCAISREAIEIIRIWAEEHPTEGDNSGWERI